jgi:hypothetical protein
MLSAPEPGPFMALLVQLPEMRGCLETGVYKGEWRWHCPCPLARKVLAGGAVGLKDRACG